MMYLLWANREIMQGYGGVLYKVGIVRRRKLQLRIKWFLGEQYDYVNWL
jgi:hypothetical protein